MMPVNGERGILAGVRGVWSGPSCSGAKLIVAILSSYPHRFIHHKGACIRSPHADVLV